MKAIEERNEILPGIGIIDLALWLPAEKALVVADLHLGYEEMLNRQGAMLPRFNFHEIKKRLQKILASVQPETIVVNGDLKHEFGTVSEQEWREVIDVIELLEKHCSKIVLIGGNHDTILGPLAKRKNLDIAKEFFLQKEKALVLHGDSLPGKKSLERAQILLIGHEHPAITLREGAKRETSKCFLKGKFKGKFLVVQPSMNAAAIGTDVLSEKLLSPMLQQPLDEFEAWLVEDRVYYFGKLKDLKH